MIFNNINEAGLQSCREGLIRGWNEGIRDYGLQYFIIQCKQR